MIAPVVITGLVLGLLYTTRKPDAATSAATPTKTTPPTQQPSPPTQTPQPARPKQIEIGPDYPSGTLRARVGDTLRFHGFSKYSDEHPEGYKLDFPQGGALVYQQTGINDYLLTQPGRFSVSWSPNTIVVVEVSQ